MTVDVEHPASFSVEYLYDAAAFLAPRRQVTSAGVHAHTAVGTSAATATDVMQVTAICREHLDTPSSTHSWDR